MNEEQKHIESCRAEDPLAQTMEACGNESDIQAALQPLLVETMPGYEPVPTTAPTSPIAELPNVLISIIRRVATKPLAILGDRPAKQSLLGSLVTTWNAIRQRLSGNPSAGIPDRRADMSGHSLPTALALLSARKITNGGAEDGIADGMSLARLLMDSTIEVTELKDDNHGWVLRRALPTMPACKKVTLGCKSMPIVSLNPFANLAALEEIYMNELEALDNRTYEGGNSTNVFTGNYKKIELKGCKTLHCNNMNGSGFFHDITTECELDMSSCEYVYCWATNSYPMTFRNCPGIKKWKLGKLTSSTNLITAGLSGLQDIEFGQGTACNLDLSLWAPDTTASDFLLNFRDYIALRLTDNGSGLTLTLSQAVYDTIKDESHLFVFDEGTMTIYAYLTNIKHWTVTK